MIGKFITFPVLLIALASMAQAQVEAARTPITWVKPVQDKNFYLLSLIERNEAVKTAFLANPALKALGDSKRAALANAVDSCEAKAACYTAALRFTDAEIAEAGRAIGALFKSNADLRQRDVSAVSLDAA